MKNDLRHNFRELNVWKRVRTFIKEIYALSQTFPKSEQFGMTSQLTRSSLSISLNIIEGTGRSTNVQLANFLNIAYGSAKEVEGILIHCYDLSLINQETAEKLETEIIEIQKMLYALRKTILKNNQP